MLIFHLFGKQMPQIQFEQRGATSLSHDLQSGALSYNFLHFLHFLLSNSDDASVTEVDSLVSSDVDGLGSIIVVVVACFLLFVALFQNEKCSQSPKVSKSIWNCCLRLIFLAAFSFSWCTKASLAVVVSVIDRP